MTTCALKDKAAKQVAQSCRDRMAKAKVAAVWLSLGKDLAGLHERLKKITPRGDHHAGWQKAFELKDRHGRRLFPFSRVMADRYIAVHQFFTATVVSAEVIDKLPASFRALETISRAKMTAEQIVDAVEADQINAFSTSSQVYDHAWLKLGLSVPKDEPAAVADEAAPEPAADEETGSTRTVRAAKPKTKQTREATERKWQGNVIVLANKQVGEMKGLQEDLNEFSVTEAVVMAVEELAAEARQTADVFAERLEQQHEARAAGRTPILTLPAPDQPGEATTL